MERVQLQHVRVEIDAASHDEVFWCWTDPRVRWNGWATPAFDRDQAERVIAWCHRMNREHGNEAMPTTFAWDGDVLVQTDHNYDSTDRIEPDSNGRYGIGSFAWVWTILDADAPTEDDALDAWLAARAAETSRIVEAANAALNAAYAQGATVAEAVAASDAAAAES